MWYRKRVPEISRGVASNNIADDQQKKEKKRGGANVKGRGCKEIIC